MALSSDVGGDFLADESSCALGAAINHSTAKGVAVGEIRLPIILWLTIRCANSHVWSRSLRRAMPRVSTEMTQEEFVACCRDACSNLAQHFAHMPDEQFEAALREFVVEVLAALARTCSASMTSEMIADVTTEVQEFIRIRRRRIETGDFGRA